MTGVAIALNLALMLDRRAACAGWARPAVFQPNVRDDRQSMAKPLPIEP
jgi:hypothetical protein